MPNLSLVDIAKILFKMALFGVIIISIIAFVGEITTMLSKALDTIKGAFNSLNGINLGTSAKKIGLVDLLNNILHVTLIGGLLLLQGVIAITIFKMGLKLYSLVFKV